MHRASQRVEWIAFPSCRSLARSSEQMLRARHIRTAISLTIGERAHVVRLKVRRRLYASNARSPVDEINH